MGDKNKKKQYHKIRSIRLSDYNWKWWIENIPRDLNANGFFNKLRKAYEKQKTT